MTHTCHAHDCETPVPSRVFACRPHWFLLPENIRAAILREYRPGQERTKDPSASCMAVQRFAVGYLAFRPNDDEAARVVARYFHEAFRWRTLALAQGAEDPLRGLLPEETTA